MNQRVADILNYLDESQPTQTTTSNDNEPSDEETEVQSSTPTQPQAQMSVDDLNAFNDDKVFNKFSRQLKKNKYPMIFEGRVFNNETEAFAFKNDILNHRKENRKMLRQQKITNSKMNFEAMPTVDENKDSEYYEQDGMIYQIPKSPYAVVKDGVKRVIPKTSKKDTKAIAETIKKHGGKEAMKNLVKAESEDKFQEISSHIINSSGDDDVKNKYYNHVNNDLASDHTWHKEAFMNLIQQMMQMQNDVNQLKESAKPKRMQGGLNPALFKH